MLNGQIAEDQFRGKLSHLKHKNSLILIESPQDHIWLRGRVVLLIQEILTFITARAKGIFEDYGFKKADLLAFGRCVEMDCLALYHAIC